MRPFFWGYLASLIATAAGLTVPLVIGRFIDRLEQGAQVESLLWLIATGFGLFLIQGFGGYARRRTLLGATTNLHHILRTRAFAHALGLDLFFHRTESVGSVATVIEYDTKEVATFFGHTILDTLLFAFTFLGTALALLLLSPKLALLSLLPALVGLGLAWRFHRGIRELGAKIQHGRGEISHQIFEALKGLESVKVYQGERQVHGALVAEASQMVASEHQLILHQSKLFPLVGFGASLVLLITLTYGAWQVSAGVVSIGSMAAFYYYIARALGPMRQTPSMLYAWARAATSFDRVKGLMSAQSALISGPTVPADGPGTLTLHDVSFRYQEAAPLVLQGLGLTIAPGDYVAILGPSGAGKSTLGRLIPRLLDPTSGHLSWSQTPYPELEVSALRAKIGYVGQEVYLFEGSLRENLLFGLQEEEIGQDFLTQTLQVAGVDEIVHASPEGLDTVYGRAGGGLSGGQKKRVALARALLRRPQVLVIDQLASDLETRLHRQIFAGMRASYTGSVVYLGHRVPEAFDPTQLYWLEQGSLQPRDLP